MNVLHFQFCNILPECILVLIVKVDGVMVVTWNLNATLELVFGHLTSQLSLIGFMECLPLLFGDALESPPAWLVEWVLLLCMDGTCHRSICCNDRQRFFSDLAARIHSETLSKKVFNDFM